jgi:hypothetical protein
VRDEGNGVGVELVLTCVECQLRSTGKAEGWKALFIPGDREEDSRAPSRAPHLDTKSFPDKRNREKRQTGRTTSDASSRYLS